MTMSRRHSPNAVLEAAFSISEKLLGFGFSRTIGKVSSRVTLNLGLRYEWFGLPNGERLRAGIDLDFGPAGHATRFLAFQDR